MHISDEVEMGRVKWYLVLGVEPRQAELRGICGERTQREQVFFASTGSGGGRSFHLNSINPGRGIDRLAFLCFLYLGHFLLLLFCF